jgi:beta-lactam-binding protein with PASTA domain
MNQQKGNAGKKKMSGKKILFHLIAMAIVVVTIPYLVLAWLDSYTHHGESYAVPNVCGMQLEDAKQLLRENHLDLEIVDYKYKKGAAENEVVEQNPIAGFNVKEGRKIMLTMSSSNRPMSMVPSVIDNSSLREAEARLKSSGFLVKSVEKIDGEKDWVYAVKYDGRKLSNGESVPKGAALVIVVGAGGNDEAALGSEFDEEYFE